MKDAVLLLAGPVYTLQEQPTAMCDAWRPPASCCMRDSDH
ncbi:hypothetical protein HaLaN_16746, partial [Haematococcus lacustris]